ncbi:hypothetical protein PB01_09185 [Psychrobacillus glaciei]|uniref:Uncharacterized protein n=1 Tax=Psychrobacillus glaciei TaxID=2283160 RepID=A0A5J6SUG7_9BACI|nr:hypothetical protein PB01_09185 [Psychrobacillus glaciei]
MSKNKTLKNRIAFLIFVLVIVVGATYYGYFYKPKNSLDLYQAIAFADDFEEVKKLMLDGYEDNFKEEDFEFIKKLDTSPNRIGQFTLFEYDERTFVIMTSPGTEKLEVLAVDELPKEIRDYFLQLAP